MSKYESIKTAKDLIIEVDQNGLSTEQDDRNRAADIFGNTSVGELAALANDIGRENDKGEPDPNGSWSKGRKGTQSTFYFIAFNIWHWEQATSFFNQHTNPATKNARETEKKLAEETKRANQAEKDAEFHRSESKGHRDSWQEQWALRMDAENELKAAQNEIIALKAKLYDMIATAD